MVIGSEAMSQLVNWEDRSTCVLFGDGVVVLWCPQVISPVTMLAVPEVGSIMHYIQRQGVCCMSDPI